MSIVMRKYQEELNEILKKHKLWLYSFGFLGKRADLSDADLEGADLKDANLKYANLTNVNLTGTGVYLFKGPKDDAVYKSKDDKLYIGCQVHSLDYWLKNYVDIGKEHEYTDEEREVYGAWIKSLKEIS